MSVEGGGTVENKNDFIQFLVGGRDSGNDFHFPHIASFTGRFHLVFVRISSIVSFWVDIRQASLFNLSFKTTRSDIKIEKRETKPT